ncbi:MAG: acyltransferase family protein [Chitinophagaceae bacterium]
MRIEQLTFTRFIAAIAIVVFHYGGKLPYLSEGLLGTIFKQANVGVSYFYILSGFVMVVAMQKYQHLSLFSFLQNRLARMYPVYLLALLLVFWLKTPIQFNFITIFNNVIMLQAWWPAQALSYNYPGWSISVEWFFYLLFPFLFNYVYKKYSFRQVAFYVIAWWLLTQVFYLWFLYNQKPLGIYTVKDAYYYPLLHLNAFLLGNLGGLFYVQKQASAQKKQFIVPVFLLLFLLVLLLHIPFKYPAYHNGLMCVVFLPLVYFLASGSNAINQFFSKKPFVYLGELSFGIYIYQYPVWLACSKFAFFGGRQAFYQSSLPIFGLQLAILVLVAIISYEFIENPLRKLLRYKK